MELDLVDLSRLQFAMTAMYHFLFVPLTIGLSVMVAIMETVYVMTGRPIWRQMTKFWGTLFGINFAIGVATGITMEFQFGMNWSYYSHYVGDIFGAPLALEGLMAFFLEASFVGLFFFGWDRMSKVGHLTVTWLVAIGSNLSALWILIANAWMQNPVGAAFNPDTMRMEMTSFFEVMMNPVAQAKFVHTVSAGYVTAALFVLGVSCWYLLKGRHVELARRSVTIAASFGLAAALSVVVLGDESGYETSHNQRMKLAAIEAMWDTEKAPAPFTMVGFPDQQARETHYAIHIPYAMGIIGTRSLTTPIEGIEPLVEQAEERIRSGILAYDALMDIREFGRGKPGITPAAARAQALKDAAGLAPAATAAPTGPPASAASMGDNDAATGASEATTASDTTSLPVGTSSTATTADPLMAARETFETYGGDLGYALLLKRYVDDPREASAEQITQAAWSTVPTVWPLFWAFRIMVACGFFFILLTSYFFWKASFRGGNYPRWALRLAVMSIPLPWIAAEMGWFVAEFGRQPWAVDGILPTALAVSNLSIADLLLTLAGFFLFYTVLFVVEMSLMVKMIKKGPTEDVEAVRAWTERHNARLSHNPATEQ